MTGTGMENDPYMISTPEDFIEFFNVSIAENTSSDSTAIYAQLANDIDFNNTYAQISSGTIYNIVLDGGGFSVKNWVCIKNNSSDYLGFISKAITGGHSVLSNINFGNITLKMAAELGGFSYISMINWYAVKNVRTDVNLDNTGYPMGRIIECYNALNVVVTGNVSISPGASFYGIYTQGTMINCVCSIKYSQSTAVGTSVKNIISLYDYSSSTPEKLAIKCYDVSFVAAGACNNYASFYSNWGTTQCYASPKIADKESVAAKPCESSNFSDNFDTATYFLYRPIGFFYNSDVFGSINQDFDCERTNTDLLNQDFWKEKGYCFVNDTNLKITNDNETGRLIQSYGAIYTCFTQKTKIKSLSIYAYNPAPVDCEAKVSIDTLEWSFYISAGGTSPTKHTIPIDNLVLEPFEGRARLEVRVNGYGCYFKAADTSYTIGKGIYYIYDIRIGQGFVCEMEYELLDGPHWQIDTTGKINGGYPYLFEIKESEPVKGGQWYIVENGALIPLTLLDYTVV